MLDVGVDKGNFFSCFEKKSQDFIMSHKENPLMNFVFLSSI